MPTKTSQQNNIGLKTRPPVVVILGHIDHGKTKLLDAILKTNIVETESGGITQHVGAYEIEHAQKMITFIDTPGHEAFSAMRSRGAQVADIAILVVAGDEGVKPQTEEAVKVLQETKTPFIVALNKMDKPAFNSEKVKKQLAEKGVYVEGYGGQVPVAEISAKESLGINELLDLVLLMAEMEELKANPNEPAKGIVVESHLDSKRGNIAVLVIKSGTMKQGNFIASESAFGKVKILENFQGSAIQSASFSSPVLVVGFESLPSLGAEFSVFDSKAEMERHLENFQNKQVSAKPSASEAGGKKILKIILKADKQGSLEAIENSIAEMKYEKVGIQILTAEVGDINENDIKLADASNAIICGFRVGVAGAIRTQLDQINVEIIHSEIIYDLLDILVGKLRVMLEPEKIIKVTGRIKVLGVFKSGEGFQVVGGRVHNGFVRNSLKCRILRQDSEIGQGEIAQLQQNRINASQVGENQECGLMIRGNAAGKIEINDIVEVFEEEIIKPELK